MILDNREWAGLFWLTVFLLWALSKRGVRSSLSRFLRSLFNPVILIPLAAMFGYVALEVWVGYKLSVWHTGLMKGTIIWLIASALAMFFSYDKASEGRQFFRRSVVAALGGMVFVEFFMNLTPKIGAAYFVKIGSRLVLPGFKVERQFFPLGLHLSPFFTALDVSGRYPHKQQCGPDAGEQPLLCCPRPASQAG